MKNQILYEADYILQDSMVKNGIKNWYKKGHKIFSIGTLTLVIICVLTSVFHLIGIINPPVAIFFAVGAVIFSVVHFKGYIFAADTEVKNLHKIFETTNNCGNFRFKFFEDDIEFSTKISTKRIMYTEINKVIDVDNIIIISATKNRLFFIAKDGVADEKSEELVEFLNKKRKVEIVEKTPQKLSDVISVSSEKSREL